jgi:DNA-binding MarR family transcriptional regulator
MRTEIGLLWHRLNRGMGEHFRQAFRGYDMHPGMLMFLRQIAKAPGITVSELARQTGMVKSHVSKTMDQLVEKGYIEKRPDADDHRLMRVYLTQSSTEMMAELEGKVQAVWNKIVCEVPEQQVEAVLEGLQILLSALETSTKKTNNPS